MCVVCVSVQTFVPKHAFTNRKQEPQPLTISRVASVVHEAHHTPIPPPIPILDTKWAVGVKKGAIANHEWSKIIAQVTSRLRPLKHSRSECHVTKTAFAGRNAQHLTYVPGLEATLTTLSTYSAPTRVRGGE